MDQAVPTIPPDALSALLGAAAAPVVIDLRSVQEIAERCRSLQAETHNSPPAGIGAAT
jgi:hypothetical protein